MEQIMINISIKSSSQLYEPWRLGMGTLFLICFALVIYSPAGTAQSCSVEPVLGGKCWSNQDVIDNRIDHHAQNALFNMLESGGEAAKDASAILCAVKEQKLDGIYLPDQGPAVKRAQATGTSWWLLIPEGKHSTCYKKPQNQT